MDLKLFQAINSLAGDYRLIDVIGRFAAEHGILVMALLLAVLWFMDWGISRTKNRYAVALALETLIVARLVITPIIRAIWPRVRPFVEHQATLLINQSPLEPGFPSGHAVMAFALALGVIIYNRKAGLWLLFLAIMVSLSRVFVGVHYPTDIVGGFLLALVVTLIINYFRETLVAPIVKLLSRE